MKNRVFTQDIAEPIAVTLTVTISEGGLIQQIDGDYDDDLPADQILRLQRAVTFMCLVANSTAQQGNLLADALLHLGDHPYFEVERSLLKPLADLQLGITPTFDGRAA